MTATRQDVKNLVSGISQQPERLRYPEQLAEQINGMSNGPQGLQKRPPTRHIGKLPEGLVSPDIKAMIHTVERDQFEKYHMIFTGNDVIVIDSEGTRHTVNYENGAGEYLQTAKPREAIKAVTIADYTFIANSDRVVTMSNEVTSNQWDTQGCLINVKLGEYGRTYTITLNDRLVASYITPNGSVATDVNAISTQEIANNLSKNLISNGVPHTVGESYIHITQTTSSLKTSDGFNNTAMLGFIQATQKFTDLPRYAPNGYTVLVKGSNESNTDDYYVRFNGTTNCWEECARPGLLSAYNPSTMPHVLVRNADYTFTFKVADWAKRLVGDDDSCPIASFVGTTINDVFFVRNRLGVLAGENCILSKAGGFFQFWMDTATSVLDSDMIDQAVPDESVAILYHAVVFNEELLLFSAKAQFVGHSDSVFSPKTFRIDRTTKFDNMTTCKPLAVGRRVYFTNQRALNTSIMEYYIVEDVTAVKDATDISGHVPNLIPNVAYKILGETSENILLVLSSGNSHRIYVYKYFWSQEQRVQASWSYWDFGSAEIVGAGFFGSKLSLITRRGGCLYIEEMTFTVNTKDFEIEPYQVFLDRKAVYTIPSGTYDVNLNTTTIHINTAYECTVSGYHYGIVCLDGFFTEKLITTEDDAIVLNGNREGEQIIVGELINFSVTFSQIMIKGDDGKGGIKADTSGTLQVRGAWINYEDSGGFDAIVMNKGKKNFSYRMPSRILGNNDNKLGSLPYASGTFNIPVQGDSRDVAIQVTSTTPSQLSLIGYGWRGNHIEMGGRN